MDACASKWQGRRLYRAWELPEYWDAVTQGAAVKSELAEAEERRRGCLSVLTVTGESLPEQPQPTRVPVSYVAPGRRNRGTRRHRQLQAKAIEQTVGAVEAEVEADPKVKFTGLTQNSQVDPAVCIGNPYKSLRVDPNSGSAL
jgi:hypothetical protein